MFCGQAQTVGKKFWNWSATSEVSAQPGDFISGLVAHSATKTEHHFPERVPAPATPPPLA